MVVDLAVFLTGTDLTATHALCLYGIRALEPIHYIDIVDVLFGNMVATQPVEVIPVAHLIFHFRLSWLAGSYPYTVIVPVNLAGSNITYHAILRTLVEFA